METIYSDNFFSDNASSYFNLFEQCDCSHIDLLNNENEIRKSRKHRFCIALNGSELDALTILHFFVFFASYSIFSLFLSFFSRFFRLLSAWFYRGHNPNNDFFNVRPEFKEIYEGKRPKVSFEDYVEMPEYQNIQTRMLGADSFPYKNVTVNQQVRFFILIFWFFFLLYFCLIFIVVLFVRFCSDYFVLSIIFLLIKFDSISISFLILFFIFLF